jgi:membrane-associated phospholipid phosphatase
MDLTPVADVISLSVFVAFATVLLLASTQQYNLVWLVVIVVTILVAGTSDLLKDHLADPRPAGAANCGLFNDGGDASHENGMPSAHMAILAYVLLMIVLFLPPKSLKKPILLIIAGLWLAAMAWAQYYKLCHTPLQIVGGVGYGITFVIGTVFAGLVYIAVYAATCTRCVT